jgi:hypothetical protein
VSPKPEPRPIPQPLPKLERFHGEISAVDTAAHTITVQRPELTPLVLQVLDRTEIRLEGQPARPAVLVNGARVQGAYVAGEPNVARAIEVVSPFRRVRGILEQVGDGGIRIGVGDDRSVRLKAAQNARIWVDGEPAALDNVPVGGLAEALVRPGRGSEPAQFVALRVKSPEPVVVVDVD